MRQAMKCLSVDGRLVPEHPGAWKAHLESLAGPVEVVVKKWSDSRTKRQNRYYWGSVVPGGQDALRYCWGEVVTPEACHEILKSLFLPQTRYRNRKTGKIHKVTGSTTGLTTKEMHEYIESIRAWAWHEAGVVIESPEAGLYDDRA